MAAGTGEKTVLDQLKDWLKENQAELKNAGVSQIIGTYSGSGDEGSFDSAEAIDNHGMPVSYDLPSKVEQLIETVSDEVATADYADGDGGGGQIVLDVATATIKHTSYCNVMVEEDNPDKEL